jgi:hypothetical protein
MQDFTTEKRRFERYTLDDGILFSDEDNLIGLAQVLDISQCGIKGVSISAPINAVGRIDKIELFGTGENQLITGLSGQLK